ncbi:MAG: SurA N-terminal domain-containing protein, partial [Pseudomonadota bacterium]|nr:SurA N-terminal domain-containing protein [Pseudomonadota bacterium]
MFDFVRKHTKIMQFMLFLLIVPSFVLFGLQGYNRYREKGEPVARVDGQDILQGEWDDAHKRDIERFRQSTPTVDPKLLDSP